MVDSVIEPPASSSDDAENTPTPRRAKPPAKTKNRGRGLLIVLGAIALFALSLGGTYIIMQVMNKETSLSGSSTAEEAVLSYLNALAAGNADKALLYSAMQPEDRAFMTNEFLASLVAENPITNIDVRPNQAASPDAIIAATYKIGETEVEAEFTVHPHGKTWMLDWGFFPFDISDMTEAGPGVLMNEVELGDTATIYLFPGVYSLTLTDPMLTLTHPEFTIEYPEMPLFVSQGYTISDEGLSLIQAAIDEHLTYCLTQKTIQPEGCGFGFAGTSTGTVDPSTIAWTLVGQRPDFSAQKFNLDTTVFTVATVLVDMKFHFEAISTDKRHFYEADSSTTGIRIDFCNTDKIVVTFGTFG
ncbi:MAG: hypothetical protein FWD55_00220 [Propionibacteriaceae bacterium]|nr:hypothetical protein [Propionibacteriaceae bacterium]